MATLGILSPCMTPEQSADLSSRRTIQAFPNAPVGVVHLAIRHTENTVEGAARPLCPTICLVYAPDFREGLLGKILGSRQIQYSRRIWNRLPVDCRSRALYYWRWARTHPTMAAASPAVKLSVRRSRNGVVHTGIFPVPPPVNASRLIIYEL